MSWAKVEQVRDQVIGLRPVYSSIGNATELILEGNQVLMDRRGLKAVVQALARNYAVDLGAQRKLVSVWLNKKTLIPFYLGQDRVFIPLKMRHKKTGHDETYGYADVLFIREITQTDRRLCQIRLKNDLILEVISGKGTVLQSQHSGERLLNLLGNIDMPLTEEDKAVDSIRWMVRTLNKISQQLDRMEKKA
ncbi:MAG TPA: hypothetical protein VN426_07480 [Syntrophomonadaceae bacterium]|nr:hypothetical protein [Syntrophomonadaceae bacterium]